MTPMMFNDRCWINREDLCNDTNQLKAHFENILEKCGFGILGYVEHHFDPHGYTGLWLLSESHFAVHTFPEEGKMYVELSSCVKTPFKNYLDLMYE